MLLLLNKDVLEDETTGELMALKKCLGLERLSTNCQLLRRTFFISFQR